MCDFFLYTRSFTNPSSRRTRRVSDLLAVLFFVGELDVASGINGVNVVCKVPHLTLLYQFQNTDVHESGCMILPTQPHMGPGDLQVTCSIEL